MNRLIAALPSTDRALVESQLRLERFETGSVLHDAGECLSQAFFPMDAVVSHYTGQDHGTPVESGSVGCEGLVSAAALVGDGMAFECAVVQVPGCVAVLPVATVNDLFAGSADFRRLLGAYLQAYTAQVAQSGLCAVSHPSEARLARWLLTCLDRTDPVSPLPLANAMMAETLGIGRPAASVVTGVLQTASLIRASRDGIHILDRDGLTEAACDCYGRIRRAYERLLPGSFS